MTGWRSDLVNPDTGKRKIVILREPYFNDGDERKFPIPCGQCMQCRLQYARDWANRCMLEAKNYQHNWFVTLTYNDEHVPHSEKNPDVLTLCPDDVTKFLKRLRKAGKKFRYFYCGEYGENTLRPHYHLIIFGLELDDLVLWRRTDRGDVIYRSPLIEQTWSVDGVPIGNCELGSVTWDSCCYVARYVVKKQKGKDARIYDDIGIVPEFVRMSRRPGIARDYYDKHMSEIWNYNQIWIAGEDGGFSVKPSRYFDKLLDDAYPEAREILKEDRRKIGELIEDEKLSRTDLDVLEYRKLQEENLVNKTKCLERKLE